jgi:hypothetical protein
MKGLAAEGRTILVSSHLMNEMAVTADYLIVIGRGKLITEASTEDVIARSTDKSVRVRSPDADRLADLITGAGGKVVRGAPAEGAGPGSPGGASCLIRLGVISRDGRRLEWITTAGCAEEISTQFSDLPLDAPTPATDAARTGRPVIIRTPAEYEQRYPGPGPDTPALAAHGSSWVKWPLQVGRAPVGVIGLIWRHPQQFEPGQRAAAEDMTQLRNAGRTLAIVGYQPASILEELARVTDWATSGKFATMAAAIIEPDVSVVTYATAGHPPILIRRAETGTVEIAPPAAGPALCLPGDQDRPQYTQGQTGFDVGDIMLMYTDGLIERRGEDLEEGITRLAERLQTWQPGASLGSLCDELIASLGAEPQLDDMCVLAVSRPGPDCAQEEAS